MDEQRDAAICDSANISTSAVDSPEPEALGAKAPSSERSGFTVVRLVLGVLLLTTAGLKFFEPSPDTFTTLDLLSSPRWQMAAIEAEALLGLWLLSGALPGPLWLMALLCFSLLASLSFYLGIEGQSSCGCFGAKLSVSPWYAMGLDIAAIVALIWLRPRQGYRPSAAVLPGFGALAAGTGLILAVGLGGMSWMYGSPYDALLQLRGESITVEPNVSNVGGAVAGEQRIFSIQLTNHRNKPIKVIGGTTSCSCIATSDLPADIPPRGSRSITVRIIFRGSPGRFRHAFVLHSDDEKQATVTAWFAGRVSQSPSP